MPVGNENTVVEVAIASVAEPNKYVVLSNILEGVDNANRFVFSSEDMGVQKILDGVEVPTGLSQSLNIAGYVNAFSPDTTVIDFLQSLNDGESVNITGRTLGGNFIQGTNFKIVKKNVFPQNGRHFYNLVFTKDIYGEDYLDSGTGKWSGILFSKNILMLYNTMTGNGTDLYGWSAPNTLTRSESGGVWTATRTSDSTIEQRFLNTNTRPTPYIGRTVRASLVVSSVVANDASLRILFRDKDFSVIETNITTIAVGFTGLVSTDIVIPANTVYTAFWVRTGILTGDSFAFSSPSLILL
jgi:hypothetical protein